jgi:hypothetical protein
MLMGIPGWGVRLGIMLESAEYRQGCFWGPSHAEIHTNDHYHGGNERGSESSMTQPHTLDDQI